MIPIDTFLNHVIWEDCLDHLHQIPDNSVDFIFTDPPYAISQEGKSGIQRKETTNILQDFGDWDHFTLKDYYEFCDQWFKECIRILKPGSWICVCMDWFKTGIFSMFLAPKYMIKNKTIFTWCKSNPPTNYRKTTFTPATEHIWIGAKGTFIDGELKYPKVPNFLEQHEMKNYRFTSARCSYGITKHPTEKPLELISLFVRSLSNEGDIVLDPFAGSGSTGVVCRELGRQYILFEKEYKYWEMAVKWIYDTVESTLQEGDMLLV